MAIIQLISDFQTGSYKIGLLHSKLLRAFNDAVVVDISHDVKLHNIVEASFILRHLQTPENQGSVVLVNVGAAKRRIIYQQADNWYLLPDNGLISLVFELSRQDKVFAVDYDQTEEAIRWIMENDTKHLPIVNDYMVRIQKKPMEHDNMIVCERIFTDRFGNCYFNLTKQMFDGFFEPGRFNAKIQYVRDTNFYEISRAYEDVNPGDSLLMFSKIGYLKLSINQGSAAQLFRIKEDSKIIIQKI